MNVTAIKNDNGALSGIMIPAADLDELKGNVKSGTPLYNFLKDLTESEDQSIAETNLRSAQLAEDLYRYSFEKGVAIYYQDERTKQPDEFIRANPDGSEDLIQFEAETRTRHHLKNLVKAGEGQFAYLSPIAQESNEATVHHYRGAERRR